MQNISGNKTAFPEPAQWLSSASHRGKLQVYLLMCSSQCPEQVGAAAKASFEPIMNARMTAFPTEFILSRFSSFPEDLAGSL